MPGLIEKLRKLAFPARDISNDMNMGEAVRLDQIEETIRQHFAAPEVVEAVYAMVRFPRAMPFTVSVSNLKRTAEECIYVK